MTGNLRTSGSRETYLENFAAELTEAAYPVALQHGLGDRWLDWEVGLWRQLTDILRKCDRVSDAV